MVDTHGRRTLQFDGTIIQSEMDLAAPDALELAYTRTMMGFLLFQPAPRHILMIGLGGGSLAKYCLRRLPDTRFTAVEIDPAVIALRDTFGIPPDDERFSVVCADGAAYVRESADTPDVLLVDGFGPGGQARELCSAGFYDDCHTLLADGGLLVANLWSGDSRYGLYAARLRDCFEHRMVVVRAEDDGNRVAFAFKGGRFPPGRAQLLARSRALADAHPVGLPALAQRMQGRLEQRGTHPDDSAPASIRAARRRS
ncbi:spermine/spermidine synthase domain-containing protein [Pseudothauera rhizosphaerae]|uniref:spermine/spermidine synthase domain-containing protein n=1 Tax=Pseudothauera rhizosphaerae TaxID=2565932 RepID=UPI001E5A2054|nr:transferase [Pseudothauera rhizosphaerae]